MEKFLKSDHFRYGAPFLIALVGGSFGLKYYTELRYEIYNERHIMMKTKELQKRLGIREEDLPSIEAEYDTYKKTVDIDNWQNIRGPRPWEEGNVDFKDIIEKRANESKNQWVFKR